MAISNKVWREGEFVPQASEPRPHRWASRGEML